MQTTERVLADRRWGTPCLAYNVQLDPSPDAVRALTQIQPQVAALCPMPLHLIPAECLHVSVYAIAPFHWASPDKEAYWRKIAPSCLAELRDACGRRGPSTLCFTALRVTPHAVIATARDDAGLVGTLRGRLRGVADPEVPTPAYDLVHTTLARFAADGALDGETLGSITSLTVRVSFEVAAVRIVRECLYPSLVLEPVATIAIGDLSPSRRTTER
jgi:hypothetical protein